MLLLLVRMPGPLRHADGLNRDYRLLLCLLLLQSAFGKTGCHDQVIQASWQPHTSLQGITAWQCW